MNRTRSVFHTVTAALRVAMAAVIDTDKSSILILLHSSQFLSQISFSISR